MWFECLNKLQKNVEFYTHLARSSIIQLPPSHQTRVGSRNLRPDDFFLILLKETLNARRIFSLFSIICSLNRFAGRS